MSRSRRPTPVASASSPAELLRAAGYAAVLSGLPSTVWALATHRDPLEASLAAGHLLLPRSRRRAALLAAAGAAHGALSLGWTVVLTRLPVHPVIGGAAMAALDLGLAHAVRGDRFGPAAELPVLPQVADHLVFGAVLSWTARARPSVRRGVG